MADAKLSELTAATSAAASDTTYLVQSATSKRITIASLFGSIATPTVFGDKIQIQDKDTMSGSGAIPVTSNITLLADPTATGNLTITSGSEGQVKIIVMPTNTSGYTYTLSGSTVEGSISFDAAGDTAMLIYISDKWYMIGGTANIT